MAFRKETGPAEPVARPMCAHLRSKAMHVFGDAGEACPHGDPDSQPCWCVLTQHSVGPDDGLVSAVDCGSARDCYKARI